MTSNYEFLLHEKRDRVHIVTIQRPSENRLNTKLCQDFVSLLRDIAAELGSGSEGALITRGAGEKFFSTGLDFNEEIKDGAVAPNGFIPLLRAFIDFPFPTIACINGHAFGGACPLALAHDYRIMNATRGFFCMPPVDLGLFFPGITALPAAKLRPEVARKLLFEAHRFTGEEALKCGIVDRIEKPEELGAIALDIARKWQSKAKGGVYHLLRRDIVHVAFDQYGLQSHVRSSVPFSVSGKL